MCGIICILSRAARSRQDLKNEFEIFQDIIRKRGPDCSDTKIYYSENCNVLLSASVLWLQGKSMTKQPVENDEYMFIYNGDIFGGLPKQMTLHEGDTKILFQLMQNTSKLITILSHVEGPYAFVFLDKFQEKLYFGRDMFGRRSLLIGKHNDSIILTSVAKRVPEYTFIELPSIGTFCWDLKTNQLQILPWKFVNPNFKDKLADLKRFLDVQIFVENKLESTNNFKFVEPNQDHLQLYKNLKNVESIKIFETLINNPEWFKNIMRLKNLLENAIEKRIASQPKYCKVCINEQNICHHSLVGILFSGGVDCSILALLADKFIDKNRPIDLINVAFDEANNYQTPDRKTGLQTLEELRFLNPERNWNFIQVNISQEELNMERHRCIADLVYPLQSVLDDSLGCALWFASRGREGSVESTVRILLVGMGADELFGGYTRHRAALKKEGWLGLHNVLLEDWQNLPYRNLARDDRVVSDHGRQLRTPYLDENLIQFVHSLNLWEKTYPSEEITQGVGEKILLRSLAYYLGLKNAASLKKRALQFGSRIANSKEKGHEKSTRL